MPTLTVDLYPAFAATTIRGPMHWSMGQDVIRDAKYDPDCGFMLECEAGILYESARRCPGDWVDIGSRFGWTAAHIAEAGCRVICVDPHYSDPELAGRFASNVSHLFERGLRAFDGTSERFFAALPATVEPQHYRGFCIDGNHEPPFPLNDAKNALPHLADTGVIIFHDFWSHPIRQGVAYLISAGLKCRVYDTPAGLAVCWRGEFTPPDYAPDSRIDWAEVRRAKAPEFQFEACV